MEIQDIKKVNLAPDDVVIISCEQVLSDKQRARIVELCQKSFGDNKVVVIDGGLRLEVVSVAASGVDHGGI